MAKQNGAAKNKPNILVSRGDDIGIPRVSAYTQGLMGYRTPNIDRIAKEGMWFPASCGERRPRRRATPSPRPGSERAVVTGGAAPDEGVARASS
jgi:hypothetical protein